METWPDAGLIGAGAPMQIIVLMFRMIGVLVGTALVLVGLPTLIMPIPLGLIMIVAGIAVLAASSTHVADFIARQRRRSHSLDAALTRAERITPRFLRGREAKRH